jgi:hypothetical protein
MLANASLDDRGDAAKYAGPESPPLSEDNLPIDISNCLKEPNHRNTVKKSGDHFPNLTELPPLFYFICRHVHRPRRCRFHSARLLLCRAAGGPQLDSPDG